MQKLISQPLGLYGWNELDPVILAALVTEEPLLLVGSHGCAKSFILERLAETLQMEFRSYNASIINYDDLVGIPMPDETKTDLHFISLPDSIWNAEIVFIDEINRTRPDLQNKLFPIIYDKRIQGRELGRLRYRWAAMNPPDDDESDEMQYLGAMPLDAALADRFTFVVHAPDWGELSDKDRDELLTDQFAGRHGFEVDIRQLINEARQHYQRLVKTSALQIAPYISILCDQLRTAHYDISTRRATMLLRSLLAIHASRLTLANDTNDITLYSSAQIALRHTIPDRARKAISNAGLIQICKHAWELASMDDDNAKKILLRETDLVERLHKLLKNPEAYDSPTIASVVTDGIAAASGADRKVWALISYLKLRTMAELPATTIETLAKEIKDVFAHKKFIVTKNRELREYALKAKDCINKLLESEGDSDMLRYTEKILYALVANSITSPDPQDTARLFTQLWKEVIK